MQTKAQLRRFPFFQHREVVERSSGKPVSVLKSVKISCVTSGRGLILIGDSSGMVYGLNKTLAGFSIKFLAFSICINHLIMSKKIAYAFSVGTDLEDRPFLLKVWDLDKIDNNGIPFCSRISRLKVSDENAMVSCASLFDSLTQFAVGFDSGTILIQKGNITREKSCKAREINYFKSAITGLEFMFDGRKVFLFVTTLEVVGVIDLQSKSQDLVTVIDSVGCNPGCSSILEGVGGGEFIVATDEGINGYKPEGRSQFISFEGRKGFLRIFKNNLIYSVKQLKFAGVDKSLSTSVNLDILYSLTIDNKMKYISFSKSIPDVYDVVYEWSSVYAITSTGKLFEIVESSLETKLDALFKKNMFDLAISLAKQKDDGNIMNTVLCKYGDHLYSKGDYEGAVTQFVATIGRLDPSYVIRKFLDVQNICYLTTYMEHLHKHELANSDHTTLLLNCYIHLKDVAKVDEFLKRHSDWHFDVNTALKVCQQAGLYQHALSLAEKTQNHSWYLKIQLEGVKDYKKALEYLKRLKFSDARDIIKNYGRLLLRDSPTELMEYLKTICTMSEANPAPCDPEDLMHIFLYQRAHLKPFLEHIISVDKGRSKHVYNTLIELYTYEIADAEGKPGSDAEELTIKCLRILDFEEDRYDHGHALMLCQLNGFSRGLVLLYEKQKKFSMIMQYHMDMNDYNSIIVNCRKYGDCDPLLWQKALSYFATKHEQCEEHMNEAISYISENDVIPAVSVVRSLSKSETISISSIKEYVCNKLKESSASTKEHDEYTSVRMREIEETEKTINEIKSGNKVFQNSKCSLCLSTLELPAAHFLCGHSYHQHCIETYDEAEGGCPQCYIRIRSMRSVFESEKDYKNVLSLFEDKITTTPDPMHVVSRFLKYDIFNKVVPARNNPQGY